MLARWLARYKAGRVHLPETGGWRGDLAGQNRFDLEIVRAVLRAVGRALLADPNWPAKIREGRLDEIVPFTPECLKTLT